MDVPGYFSHRAGWLCGWSRTLSSRRELGDSLRASMPCASPGPSAPAASLPGAPATSNRTIFEVVRILYFSGFQSRGLQKIPKNMAS